MKTVGIIAEYNPFHNGHFFQIEQIRKKTNADTIVVVMSGNYVQRGTPAWTDKFLRTKMALCCGADFVFELPTYFATSSAEGFAQAGINLLSSLGFIDYVCFGTECKDISILQAIANFLATPPDEYHAKIQFFLSKGMSYPIAQTQAIIDTSNLTLDYEKNELLALLSSPNNILAIEYLKAVKQQNSTIIPYNIQRNDHGYHNNSLDYTFSSATAIRKHSFTTNYNNALFLADIKHNIPDNAWNILSKNPMHYPISEDDFSNILFYRICQLQKNDYNLLDMTPEIFHRIQNVLSDFHSFSDFSSKIKTKQYTYSRISRVLLHIMLNLYKISTDFNQKQLPLVPYARLLGFNSTKTKLLRCKSKIPFITKPADGIKNIESFYRNEFQNNPLYSELFACTESSQEKFSISDYISLSQKMYTYDIFSSNLYYQVQSQKNGLKFQNELRRMPEKK